jgi:hypothetical protein
VRRGLAVFVAAAVLSGCAWTQYRGSAARTGANLASGVTAASLGSLRVAWTSADHGIGQEVVERGGRVVAPGSTALWALDLGTGAEAWHVDRTFGHQGNSLLSASTWRSGRGVVAMVQRWFDSISGTPFFQDIGQVTQLDLTTGAVLSSEDRGGVTPPVVTDERVYFPQVHIIGRPPSIGPSEVDIKVVARALDGSGDTFTATVSGSVPVISDVAVDRDALYVRDRFGLRVFPAEGCGQPTCAPTWTSDFGSGSTLGRIAVADGHVVDLDQSGRLTVLPTSCAAATCAPLWAATITGATGTVAVAGGRIFVTAGSTLSTFTLTGCDAATCAPDWTSTASGPLSTPSVANDVVLAGTTTGDLVAWSTNGCGTSTCPVMWSQPQGGAVGPVTPIDHALLFPVGGAVRKLVAAA